MRSRATNMLQVVVLITGIAYIIIGIFLYIVPPLVALKFFAENISENWFDLVRDHELVAPLYYIARSFSALVLTSGIAMVMPLFDPLRYRGLIYYNGVIFPLLGSIPLLINGIPYLFISRTPVEGAENVIAAPAGHLILLVLGVTFVLICIASLSGLLITRGEARKGVE